MPSTTTTSVSLGPILDLLGPGAQSPGPAKEQPPFDSLLKASAPTSGTRPEAPIDRPSRRDESPTPTSSTTDSSDSAQNQTQPVSSEERARSLGVANEESDPSQPPAEQSQSAHVLLVESLAGLVAATPPIAALDTSVAPDVAGNSSEQAPSESEFVVSSTKPSRKSITKTSAAAIAPISSAEPGEPSPGASGDALASPKSSPSGPGVDPSPDASQQNPFAAEILETSQGELLESTSGDSTRLENQWADTSGESTADSPDHNDGHPDSNETSVIELTSAAESAPLAALNTAEKSNQSPAAAPLASQPTLADSPSAATNSNSASAIAFSPQARLPADVLAQPASTSNRRSTTAIDTTRLLTRVARAFAAAQERDGEIRLRLSPPELGSLRLDVRIQDGALVARLQAETDAARTAIIENLPALRERLSDQGVRIERFDVDLMQRQPGGTPDQPGRQDAEALARPLRVTPVSRSRPEAPAGTRPSSAVGSTGGLNVIV